MSNANGHNNEGHGHVFARPDGVRMRCGGPRMCADCSVDFVRKNSGEDTQSAPTSVPRITDAAIDAALSATNTEGKE